MLDSYRGSPRRLTLECESDVPDIRLSVAVMHHPSRSALIPDLVQRCLPLTARVIEDPDPLGRPSALRTAKVAWAAIADGATHHLVIQDDVLPVPGFADQLLAAISQRPEDGVTLCVNWNSPHNSYLTRRAALAGSSWGPLSPFEWIPTLGLALPAEAAAALAAKLAELADDSFWGDDDEAIIDFCKQRGLRVVSTIPHLVDHTDMPSLAGNELLGSRHGTVLCPASDLAADHWTFADDPVPPLALRGAPGYPSEYVVELRNSRCSVRFVRPGVSTFPRPGNGEFLEHPFGWYWHDWAGLAGIDPEQVLDGLEKLLSGRPEIRSQGQDQDVDLSVAIEVWAAGYLLGADPITVACRRNPQSVSPDSATPDSGLTATKYGALSSWIDSGLLTSPAPEQRAAYIGLCAAGYVQGLTDAQEQS
jgi:hypothetical protein